MKPGKKLQKSAKKLPNQRSLRNQGSKPESINIKGSARTIIKKKLRDEAESSQNKQRRQQLKKERNTVLNKLRNQFNFEKTAELDEGLKDIEAYKDDASKYYQPMRKVNSKNLKPSFEIYDDSFNLITSGRSNIQNSRIF